MRNKVISAAEAAELVHSGDTLAITGFATHGCPEALLAALERRFLERGEPRDLTILFGVAAGDFSDENHGHAHLAHRGLLKRVIGAHFTASPKFARMLVEDNIEAYNLPLGVIAQLYRDMAAGLPGRVTPIGLGTFVDPRLEGGKVNGFTKEDIVSVVSLAGEEMLFYKKIPISIAFIRGTAGDADGNIILDRESLTLDVAAAATAAKNAGGLVIAQVEYIADTGSLNARAVKVPGSLVDGVVLARPEEHKQSLASPVHNYAFSSEARVPLAKVDPMPLDERKIIARRAALELSPNAVVNLGVGMPEGVANVANEERVVNYLTMTTEPGVIGGVPVSGRFFGTGLNADAVIDMDRQFDFYDGGGLDLTFLGLAQCDEHGNVNVSRFGKKLAGCGGFINISQGTKRIVFVGTFTAGAAEIRVANGELSIVHEGMSPKFLKQVQQVTFSSEQALRQQKRVLYITERCVFELTQDGLKMIEIAPGIEIERDILPHMDFMPIIDRPRQMDARIFAEAPMGLKDTLIALEPKDRFVFDAERETMFMNFEGLRLRNATDVGKIWKATHDAFAPLGRKVHVIVNYDSFEVAEDALNSYADAVRDVSEKYYQSVSRYTTSAFMRLKLGEAMAARSVKPHLFESKEEALKYAREL